MPREQITKVHPRKAYVTGISPATEDWISGYPKVEVENYTGPCVHVEWNATEFSEPSVKLGIEVHPEDIKVRATPEFLEKELDPQHQFIWLWTDHLSREELNDTIRILRQARNEIFGEDL